MLNQEQDIFPIEPWEYPWPQWWHHHGIKMAPTPMGFGLVFSGSAARLTIQRIFTKPGHEDDFLITGEIRHSAVEFDRVVRQCSTKDLLGMFEVGPYTTGELSMWMIHRYLAGHAKQRLFIRKNQYLNFPGPGTGHDGDPNLSIELTPEIQEAVRRFVRG